YLIYLSFSSKDSELIQAKYLLLFRSQIGRYSSTKACSDLIQTPCKRPFCFLLFPDSRSASNIDDQLKHQFQDPNRKYQFHLQSLQPWSVHLKTDAAIHWLQQIALLGSLLKRWYRHHSI